MVSLFHLWKDVKDKVVAAAGRFSEVQRIGCTVYVGLVESVNLPTGSHGCCSY
jgi:hypothetical protein